MQTFVLCLQLLEEFRGSEVGKKNHLVLLLGGSSAAWIVLQFESRQMCVEPAQCRCW